MATLTNTAQLLKKIGTPISIFLLIIILFGAIYWRYKIKNNQTNEKPAPNLTIQENIDQKQPGRIDFSNLEKQQIPKELPDFEAQNLSLSDQTAQEIAAAFGVTNQTFLVEENTLDGRQYNWQQNNIDLSLSQSRMLFKKNGTSQPVSISQAELEERAVGYIAKIPYLEKDLSIINQKTKYLKEGSWGIESVNSFEAAQIIEFSFDKKLQNLPIVTNSAGVSYLTVRLNRNGEVIYLSSRLFSSFDQKSVYRIKSQKEAQQEIKNGLGKIVSTKLLDENGQALELFRNKPVNVNLAVLTNLSLAYLLPDNLGEFIQPIYVGIGHFQEGKDNGEITIYLPAFKSPN